MWGQRLVQGDRRLVRFEQKLGAPPERVWEALTAPQTLAGRMGAEAAVDPWSGGRYALAFRGGRERFEGRVTRMERPRVIEHSWPARDGGASGTVLWELEPAGEGCHLRLTHSLAPGDDEAAALAGWHWHLDAFEDALAGRNRDWNRGEFRDLKLRYARQLALTRAVREETGPGVR